MVTTKQNGLFMHMQKHTPLLPPPPNNSFLLSSALPLCHNNRRSPPVPLPLRTQGYYGRNYRNSPPKNRQALPEMGGSGGGGGCGRSVTLPSHRSGISLAAIYRAAAGNSAAENSSLGVNGLYVYYCIPTPPTTSLSLLIL